MINTSIGKVRKLRGKSLAEVFVRGSQFLASSVERSAVSRARRVPRLDRVCRSSLQSSATCLFDTRLSSAFPGLAVLNESADAVRASFPDAAAATIEHANAVVRGHFRLLGHDDLFFGNPIDWHLDPTSGRRSALRHWSRIDYLDPAVVGDHKVVWELNRHQHFLVLGQAYCLTGDDSYALAFTEQLSRWMDDNPPTLGVNWASSLEVAFRAIAWIWAFAFFRDSGRFTEPLRARAIGMLHAHGRHVERYLSTYFSPNTHLTGEALGLVYLGSFLPQLRRAKRWRRLGWRVLRTQIDRHVRSDGVYFEQASYYQRYTADFYLHLLRIGEAYGADVSSLREPLCKLLEHLVHLQRPDGTTPYIGDDDGGRLLPLDARPPNDFRTTLATAAVIFDRPDFRHAAGTATQEIVWLLGPAARHRFDEMAPRQPEKRSAGFAAGGYYVSRDSWGADANYSVVDCGPHGADNCGHAHADALSIEIAARGRAIFVDPGTFTYTSTVAVRDHFRSSAAHNTVTLDGESSSSAGGPFSWNHVARSTTHAWYSESRFDYFEGAHDGFARLGAASHVRSLLFIRGSYWIVRDQIASCVPHNIEIAYQCAPDLVVALDGSTAAIGNPNDDRWLHLSVHGSTSGQLSVTSGWVSPAYGHRLSAARCAYRLEGMPQADLLTALVPFAPGAAPPRVTALESTRGSALRIDAEGRHDVLLVGDSRGAASAAYETDARWMWLRHDPSTGAVCELILIGGQRATVNGEVLCDAGSRVRWLSARRVSGGWITERDGASDQAATTFGPGVPCAASAA